MVNVTFPNWVRIALGLLVAFIGYLLTGGVFTVDEDARTAIGTLTVLLASVGIVPPKPGELVISQGLRVLLIVAVVVLTYLTQAVFDLDEVVRGILQALILLAASVGIVPPQTDAARR